MSDERTEWLYWPADDEDGPDEHTVGYESLEALRVALGDPGEGEHVIRRTVSRWEGTLA